MPKLSSTPLGACCGAGGHLWGYWGQSALSGGNLSKVVASSKSQVLIFK